MARSQYKGPINDKERSKLKLIEGVGKVIRENGYKGLTASNIAKKAGVHRSLIYVYFESLNALIETYVRGKDYFVGAEGNAGEELSKAEASSSSKDILENMLINQMDYFIRNEEWQKIILWQISERSQVMYEIAEQREKLGEDFFSMAEVELAGKNIDLRPVAALLVAGIYYMVLHTKSNDSLFCGINLNTNDGKERVRQAIKKILNDTYGPAKSPDNEGF